MKLFHGSKKNNLQYLQSFYIGGNNGSVDGVGVNMTNDLGVALRYSSKDGSIYVVDIDTSDYLLISKSDFLSANQAVVLVDKLKELPVPVQCRLATDICGKKIINYTCADKAINFYKEEKEKIKNLDMRLDRMLPRVEDEGEHYAIHVARTDFDLEGVSTSHIHYCLNLYDNQLSSTLLKSICGGLEIKADSGHSNFLSFDAIVGIEKEITGELLQQDNIKDELEYELESPSSSRQLCFG
jgi:hypothetical protein